MSGNMKVNDRLPNLIAALDHAVMKAIQYGEPDPHATVREVRDLAKIIYSELSDIKQRLDKLEQEADDPVTRVIKAVEGTLMSRPKRQKEV